MDWQSLLYDPVYTTLGVPGVLSIAGSSVGSYSVTVRDLTTSVEAAELAQVHTESVIAGIRMAELLSHGITREDLNDNTLEFNGETFRIQANEPRRAPSGLADGQVYLILHVIESSI